MAVVPSPESFKGAVDWLLLLVDLVPRFVDYFRSLKAPFSREAFIRLYCGHLEKAILLTGPLREGEPQEHDKLRESARVLLETIAYVVESYDNRNNAKVNANCMIPQLPTSVPRETIRFTGGRDLSTFDRVLSLTMWAENSAGLPAPGTFALPVEHGSGQYTSDLLFGAPTAYLNGSPHIVSNTLRVYRKVENQYVRNEVKKYFRDNESRLLSFVSFPLKSPPNYRIAGRNIAVVNIQSTKKALLGYSTASHTKLHVALSPFFLILSYFLAELYIADIDVEAVPEVS